MSGPRMIIGVSGGVAAGKKTFSSLLSKALQARNVRAVQVEESRIRLHDPLPASDCVIVHGLTPFSPEEQACHWKIYLDVDADVRLSRMLARESSSAHPQLIHDYNTKMRPFHQQHVIKNKALADFCLDCVTEEKVDEIADMVARCGERAESDNDEQLNVYLGK